MRLIHKGNHKYVHVVDLPPLLFELEKDPHELDNKSGEASYTEIESELRSRVLEGWDGEEISKDIRNIQKNRILLNRSLNKGKTCSWDWKPRLDPANQYVLRDAQIDNEAARYPRIRTE